MSNNEDFLPPDYEIPKSPSRYTKFEKDWTTKIRILPQEWDKITQIYYEYFDTRWEKPKSVRSIKEFETTPWIREWEHQKQMWSFKVWNYDKEIIQICSIWQKSIQESIFAYHKEEAYWNPTWYDLKISREWEKLTTKYSIVALPPKPFDKSLLEWKEVNIDWIWFLECETEIFKTIED